MNPIRNKIPYVICDIDPLINILISGSKISHTNMFSNPIIKIGKRKQLLGLCNTYYCDSGDKYPRVVIYVFKDAVFQYIKYKH